MRGLYLITLLGLLLPSFAGAVSSPTSAILISEIQTGSLASASEEFIELYNSSSSPIDVSNYRVEYFSAASTGFATPSRSVTLHGVLPAGSHYLIASNGYLSDSAEDSFSATLAKTGGHVRLVSPDPLNPEQLITHDLVGWGTAAAPETSSAPAPGSGESLQRNIDADGNFIDTNHNFNDFALNLVPTPQSYVSVPIVEEPSETETPEAPEPEESTDEEALATTGTTETPESEAPELLPPQITELLPNPAPPAIDAEGEFIELYNPNSEALDLSGYKLQSGSNFSYSFTFDDETIPAGSYLAFYVTDTDALLANSGGRARLIDPSGAVVSETLPYGEADDGLSWILLNALWQWTTSPTPNAANVLTLLPEPAAKIAKTTAKPAPKKAAAKKPKIAAASTKKNSKKAAAATDRNVYTPPPDTSGSAPLHPMVLAGIGGLTLLYGSYEYRYDFANRLDQLRRYRASRRARRQSA